ncbi:MAG: hypothetical protein K6G61_11775 [Solobacterium sp.]|nr:hypothetical protein [Solobacterium sp.]
MLRKILISLTAFMLLTAVMPVQLRAEETGESAEQFEDYAYTITIVCHAAGGVFDPEKALLGTVSDDRETMTYETLVESHALGDENEGDEVYVNTLDIPPENKGLSRKGHVFDGWYRDAEYSEPFSSSMDDEEYLEETHIYAKWKEVWKKGWREVDKGWKYSQEEGSDYKNGVYKIGAKYYGFDADGFMVKGWKKFGRWYYFASSGAAVTGWKKISKKWYYFNSSGVMQTDWQKIAKKWYYFTSGGAMVTGWKKIGGKWYYFQSSGAMKTGWLKLSGKWYYFTSSGAMVTGTRKIGSKTYTFSSSGVCTNP